MHKNIKDSNDRSFDCSALIIPYFFDNEIPPNEEITLTIHTNSK